VNKIEFANIIDIELPHYYFLCKTVNIAQPLDCLANNQIL
jgi:hypothetical protein